MGWTEAIGEAVQYIEDHITDELTAGMIAEQVHLSSFYFQKGFAMLCGYTIMEYIRNRRLALAGNALVAGDEKIIDIAMKYGYDSPDSFARAFYRFHGVTPNMALKEYEFAAGYCVEMYDDPTKYPNGTGDENYYCEIWIPVKKKQ